MRSDHSWGDRGYLFGSHLDCIGLDSTKDTFDDTVLCHIFRDEHGSGLDRTAIFFKIGGSGLDRTEKIFFVSMLLFLF